MRLKNNEPTKQGNRRNQESNQQIRYHTEV